MANSKCALGSVQSKDVEMNTDASRSNSDANPLSLMHPSSDQNPSSLKGVGSDAQSKIFGQEVLDEFDEHLASIEGTNTPAIRSGYMPYRLDMSLPTVMQSRVKKNMPTYMMDWCGVNVFIRVESEVGGSAEWQPHVVGTTWLERNVDAGRLTLHDSTPIRQQGRQQTSRTDGVWFGTVGFGDRNVVVIRGLIVRMKQGRLAATNPETDIAVKIGLQSAAEMRHPTDSLSWCKVPLGTSDDLPFMIQGSTAKGRICQHLVYIKDKIDNVRNRLRAVSQQDNLSMAGLYPYYAKDKEGVNSLSGCWVMAWTSTAMQTIIDTFGIQDTCIWISKGESKPFGFHSELYKEIGNRQSPSPGLKTNTRESTNKKKIVIFGITCSTPSQFSTRILDLLCRSEFDWDLDALEKRLTPLWFRNKVEGMLMECKGPQEIAQLQDSINKMYVLQENHQPEQLQVECMRCNCIKCLPKLMCWNCGEEGHVSKDCQQRGRSWCQECHKNHLTGVDAYSMITCIQHGRGSIAGAKKLQNTNCFTCGCVDKHHKCPSNHQPWVGTIQSVSQINKMRLCGIVSDQMVTTPTKVITETSSASVSSVSPITPSGNVSLAEFKAQIIDEVTSVVSEKLKKREAEVTSQISMELTRSNSTWIKANENKINQQQQRIQQLESKVDGVQDSVQKGFENMERMLLSLVSNQAPTVPQSINSPMSPTISFTSPITPTISMFAQQFVDNQAYDPHSALTMEAAQMASTLSSGADPIPVMQKIRMLPILKQREVLYGVFYEEAKKADMTLSVKITDFMMLNDTNHLVQLLNDYDQIKALCHMATAEVQKRPDVYWHLFDIAYASTWEGKVLSSLNTWSKEHRNHMVGNSLYIKMEKYGGDFNIQKVVGMILESSNEEIIHLFKHEEALNQKIEDAKRALSNSGYTSPTSPSLEPSNLSDKFNSAANTEFTSKGTFDIIYGAKTVLAKNFQEVTRDADGTMISEDEDEQQENSTDYQLALSDLKTRLQVEDGEFSDGLLDYALSFNGLDVDEAEAYLKELIETNGVQEAEEFIKSEEFSGLYDGDVPSPNSPATPKTGEVQEEFSSAKSSPVRPSPGKKSKQHSDEQ